MAKKKYNLKEIVLMIVYWAFYLTVTMAFFERYHITPEVVPFGAVGWMIIVEVPRVALGWIVSMLFFKNKG
ncbi:hypothetical protein KY331_01605 [Candidatus Woesearchaeota archaeon]|nr:hypothetical protein [Candidatus Woesearchaeota archaeon]